MAFKLIKHTAELGYNVSYTLNLSMVKTNKKNIY